MSTESEEIAALREKLRNAEQEANRWWAMHLKAEAETAAECVRLRTRVRELESDAKTKDAASAGSGLFRVFGTFHWSCKTEKGHQRICVSCNLELPFPPFVGMCVELEEEIPSPKIKEVVWLNNRQEFSVHGRLRLKDWDSRLLESLAEDLRRAGYKPKLYDDNWMHEH